MVNGAFSIPLVPIGDSGTAGRRPAGGSSTPHEFIADVENSLLASVTHPREIVDCGFNPLILTGPTGVGKSFLAHGLVGRWSCEDPPAEVVTCSGADFCHSFREAIETEAIDEFRRQFRNADILLIDDITDLSGKDAAQCELANTIDQLLANRHVIVVTSQVTPTRLPRFIPQLKSRLTQGLVLPIKMPGRAARHELILRLAERHGIQLSTASIALLVQSGPKSATELSGVLLEVQSSSPCESTRLDPSAIHSYLAGHNQRVKLTVNSLAKLVARRFRVRVADLKSSSRRQAIVRARGTAMYLARQYTDLSLERLGDYFGKRDHTTVLHACRQTEQRINSEPELREVVDEIANQLVGPL